MYVRIYTVRESQGEKGPLVKESLERRGKSGKHAIVRGKQHFHTVGQGKDFAFDHYRSI